MKIQPEFASARLATALTLAGALALGLSACQTLMAPSAVAPTWTIPPGVSTQTINGYPMASTTKGAGPTVVFVHGVLNDYRYWQKPLAAWTDDFRVIDVSLRHFYPEKWDGKGTDFTTPQHARDLIAFIEATGGPVYLVGWSYGGRAAYEAARARPDLVKKLVLVEASLDPDDAASMVSIQEEFLKMAEGTAKFFDAGDMEGGLKFAVNTIQAAPVWDKLPETLHQTMRDNAWTIVGAGREHTYSATCAEFGSLKMPVLIVTGAISTPRNRKNAQGQAKCLPQASVATIPKAAHSMAAMNPPAFKQAVVAFLQH